MSMHKQMIGKIGPRSVKDDVYTTSGRKEDVTLADYIARKTKEPMTFAQWYTENKTSATTGLIISGMTFEEWLFFAWKAAQENM